MNEVIYEDPNEYQDWLDHQLRMEENAERSYESLLRTLENIDPDDPL